MGTSDILARIFQFLQLIPLKLRLLFAEYYFAVLVFLYKSLQNVLKGNTAENNWLAIDKRCRLELHCEQFPYASGEELDVSH